MPVLEATGITKAFPGVVALDDVSVAFEPGRIHGIVGENGAGKSTLVKILDGVLRPDKGTVRIEGEDAFTHPRLFEKISYVPQELLLFRHMTVAENLFMPFWTSGVHGLIRQQRLFAEALPWLDLFQIDVAPSRLAGDISVSNQQLLQIARATVKEQGRILVLDEPTTSLTAKGISRLFEVIRQLKSQGRSIIFISHKLDEISDLCDEVTVLRNGVKVGYSRMGDVDHRWLIRHMSGRDIDEGHVFRPRTQEQSIVLEVEGLSGQGFADISFLLHRGEILGFAGLVGAGRSEIMQTVFGRLPAKGGRVLLDGKPLKLGNPRLSIREGLVYLPEERRQQGILPLLSVRHNISISTLRQLTTGGVISARRESALVQKMVDTFDIRTPSLERPIMFLSGGNQQKVVIGRAMACVPKVLILDEPTKGIDVGTKTDLYGLMRDLVEGGETSMIFISSDLDELLRCANRVITVYGGRIVGEFNPEVSGKTEIIASMIGETVSGGVEILQ
ncbi:MAG TPA: sugar ABC transporter ATP-binding protein [bacterium]|nr:sugar ABC transporter ATP-binding protein [bacterium]